MYAFSVLMRDLTLLFMSSPVDLIAFDRFTKTKSAIVQNISSYNVLSQTYRLPTKRNKVINRLNTYKMY